MKPSVMRCVLHFVHQTWLAIAVHNRRSANKTFNNFMTVSYLFTDLSILNRYDIQRTYCSYRCRWLNLRRIKWHWISEFRQINTEFLGSLIYWSVLIDGLDSFCGQTDADLSLQQIAVKSLPLQIDLLNFMRLFVWKGLRKGLSICFFSKKITCSLSHYQIMASPAGRCRLKYECVPSRKRKRDTKWERGCRIFHSTAVKTRMRIYFPELS